jgi:hypothetical protein
MAVWSCKVTCRDAQGIEHSVDVTAETLYEAVAQAWRIFGESEWNADGGRPPSVFVVRVKRPEIEHKVRTQDFESWLGAAPKPGGDGIEESIAEDSRKRELATYF